MDNYTKIAIIEKLQKEMLGVVPKKDNSDVDFAIRIDGSTKTVYCNIFGHSFTEKDVRSAWEYYKNKVGQDTDSHYNEIAALCIENVLRRQYESNNSNS